MVGRSKEEVCVVSPIDHWLWGAYVGRTCSCVKKPGPKPGGGNCPPEVLLCVTVDSAISEDSWHPQQRTNGREVWESVSRTVNWSSTVFWISQQTPEEETVFQWSLRATLLPLSFSPNSMAGAPDELEALSWNPLFPISVLQGHIPSNLGASVSLFINWE